MNPDFLLLFLFLCLFLCGVRRGEGQYHRVNTFPVASVHTHTYHFSLLVPPESHSNSDKWLASLQNALVFIVWDFVIINIFNTMRLNGVCHVILRWCTISTFIWFSYIPCFTMLPSLPLFLLENVINDTKDVRHRLCFQKHKRIAISWFLSPVMEMHIQRSQWRSEEGRCTVTFKPLGNSFSQQTFWKYLSEES